MKRSEMVQDLASWLIMETLNHCTPGIPFDKAQEISEILLTNLENKGIVPPPILAASENKSVRHYNSSVHKWEKE